MEPYLTPSKINTKWIKNTNGKAKLEILQKKYIREYLYDCGIGIDFFQTQTLLLIKKKYVNLTVLKLRIFVCQKSL